MSDVRHLLVSIVRRCSCFHAPLPLAIVPRTDRPEVDRLDSSDVGSGVRTSRNSIQIRRHLQTDSVQRVMCVSSVMYLLWN